MKKILVPTDFSTPSLPAYKFGAELAEMVEGELFVVHAIEVPLLQETTFGVQPIPFDPDHVRQMENRATQAFERFAKHYPANVNVVFSPIQGNVVSAITSFIEANDIDVVVMGTHGTSAFDDFFIGSNAGKTVRRSPVPVIAVPRETPVSSIKNIVFPNSLDDDQDDLVAELKALQKILRARLHVLLINTPQHFYSEEQSCRQLEEFAANYSLTDYTLNCRNHPHEAGGILSFMKEIKADLLAMATHGRKGLAHLIKGSIAESLLYAIDQPIWVWKGKE